MCKPIRRLSYLRSSAADNLGFIIILDFSLFIISGAPSLSVFLCDPVIHGSQSPPPRCSHHAQSLPPPPRLPFCLPLSPSFTAGSAGSAGPSRPLQCCASVNNRRGWQKDGAFPAPRPDQDAVWAPPWQQSLWSQCGQPSK